MKICCVLVFAVLILLPEKHFACCAVTRALELIVNADQTVILIWNAEKKRQHFIRQASFHSDASKDIGFIIPSPTQPDLEEAGDRAFDYLRMITAPIVKRRNTSFTCSSPKGSAEVVVLARKRVAGFDAVVLRAGSGESLVQWLKQNQYQYSEGVAAWAEPYIEKGWPFTALKVAPSSVDSTETRNASALRMSFNTEQPLFPYREPDSKTASEELGVSDRLLRIYFISDQIYEGKFGNGMEWPSRKMWAGDISKHRTSLAEYLKLPESDRGPSKWWLTEIENEWPYEMAPDDVVFSVADNQDAIKRVAQTQIGSIDLSVIAIFLFGVNYLLFHRFKQRTTIRVEN